VSERRTQPGVQVDGHSVRSVVSKLSVIVITHNEERNIGACLASVRWADEIVVVDSQSTDRTVELARQYTSRVHVNPWMGFAEAKNYALAQTSADWVLWLDADERVTPELAREIQQVVRQNRSELVGYSFPRRAYFLGKWIRHCGWYPGRVVRLFRRGAGSFSDSLVHEHLVLDGSIGRLGHDLLHYTDENLEQYFNKFNRYTSLAVEELVANHRSFRLLDLLARPPVFFFKMYILRLGFLDGIPGLILCALSSCYVFTKYAKLWERSRSLDPDD